MEGRTISHFRVAERIGGGGMGEVYRAEDLKLGRPVALKFLPAEAVADADKRRRFLREARTEAALSHPGIASIFEIDEANGAVFIAMELVEGKTLRETIGGHPLPLAKALKIASEMAEALAFAHDASVIHRDLKPDNVMVRPDGHVKILDFGLAKLLKEPLQASLTDLSQAATGSVELTVGMKIMGTAAYMSPEQARAEKADPRADVFAFGVMLHEMLTGRNPFRRDGYPATLEAIQHDEAPPVSQARVEALERERGRGDISGAATVDAPGGAAPGSTAGSATKTSRPDEPEEILSSLESLVERCLEKDRDRRYASMAEVVTGLEALRGRITSSQTGEAAAFPPAEGHRIARVAAAALAATLILAAAALAWPPLRERLFGAAGARKIESIAVLPFENISRDPNHEYFADGMTDVLITDLSRIHALKVIARNSVMQYKDAMRPLPEIASELRVDAILAGTVMMASNRVRVTAQLIRPATEQNIWADSFDRPLSDLFTVQKDIATAVTHEVRVQVSPDEQTRIEKPGTRDPRAYQHYLRGLVHVQQGWTAGPEALVEFQKAIEADPEYALAYVGLAIAHWMHSTVAVSPHEAMPRARAAALKALELDDQIGEAHAVMGLVASSYDLDWEAAERWFQQATELSPSYALTRVWRGTFLSRLGRVEQALEEFRIALELDPLSRDAALMSLWPLYYAPIGERQVERTMLAVRGLLKVNPNMIPALLLLAFLHEMEGDYAEAIRLCRRVSDLVDRDPTALTSLARSLALNGDVEQARSLMREVEDRSPREHTVLTFKAAAYVALGEHERALDILASAAAAREEDCLYVMLDPRFDPLHDYPEFESILRSLNLLDSAFEPGASREPAGSD